MTLPDMYDALCLLWDVDEIKDDHAIMLLEAVVEVIHEQTTL